MSFECDTASDWLPPLVTLDDCHGDVNAYLELLYSFFRKDFIDNPIYFNGKPLRVRRHPMPKGKEKSFWHILGHDEFQETPDDVERMKRIRWPKAIIVHRGDALVKVWKEERRWRLWYNDEYLVVIEERERYVLFITAYTTDYRHTVDKLQRSFENAKKAEAASRISETASDTPSTLGS